MEELYECTTTEMLNVLRDIVSKHAEKVPYLYSNLMTYGIDFPFVKIWYNLKETDIDCILLVYNHTLHILDLNEKEIPSKVKNLITQIKPNVIYVPQTTFRANIDIFNNCKVTEMYLFKSNECNCDYDENVHLLTKEKIVDIAKTMLYYPIYSNIYSLDTLVKELEERYQNKYGKIYGIEENNCILAAMTINAENNKFIFYGGLFSNPKAIGKGYATRIVRHVWKATKEAGKDGLFFIEKDNIASLQLHKKLGAEIINTIIKLTY